MDKETIKYVLAQSTTRALPLTMPRQLELPLDSNKVVTLAGIRGSGKVSALKAAAQSFPRPSRVLVAHEHASRKPPAGIDVVDAWRYLLEQTDDGGD